MLRYKFREAADLQGWANAHPTPPKCSLTLLKDQPYWEQMHVCPILNSPSSETTFCLSLRVVSQKNIRIPDTWYPSRFLNI